MSEYRNNPAIFDRLNYTKSLDKANGVANLQHVVAGNGDKMTANQLYAYKSELRLRKAFRFLVFFSIPALTFYYKKNFALGVASFFVSSYIANKVYNSSIFNSNDSFTSEFIKKSKLNYLEKIGAANDMILFKPDIFKKGVIKHYSKREFNELYRYR